jgi:predicted RNase H-like nuclease
MHPEVAFWALNNRQAMQYNKKKPEGHDERLVVLQRYYPRAAECFELARQGFIKRDVAIDDIIDALVGAVTARQSPRLATFPLERVLDDQGLPMEMVFADL